jgi:hypothetical protein
MVCGIQALTKGVTTTNLVTALLSLFPFSENLKYTNAMGGKLPSPLSPFIPSPLPLTPSITTSVEAFAYASAVRPLSYWILL